MDPQPGPPQPDQLIGQTIGNYLVTQKLGEGGMGSVYLAEHPGIGKKVALKVLHSEFSTNQEVAQRFFHEAKAVNDIGHPNIVDIVDFGVLQSGRGREQLVYFIMEYLAGATLSQLITAEAPLPPERALGIGLQVADALSASHKCGIVHRDLKPDNIILSQRGRERDFVKLLDFGIAKLTGGSATGSHRTRAGLVIGTPAYMSPEQCEGSSSVDQRTDIYALGVVLYEMLTGRVPFVGNGYSEILIQHLTQRPPPPSSFRMMSPHVEMVVLKALEKRADMRYPTMDEFMRAMSDPVGYVEANGGVTGFLQRLLMPSSAPLPPTAGIRLTPPPMTPMTPLPGTLIAPTMPSSPGMRSSPGLPGSQVVSLPYGGATTGHPLVEPAPGQPRRTLYIAVGAAIIAVAAGLVVVVASRDKAPAPLPGAGSVVATGEPVRPPDPIPAPVRAGSAAVVAPAGSGSALEPASGSAAVPASGDGAAGSGAGSSDRHPADPAPDPTPTPPTESRPRPEPRRIAIEVSSSPAGAKIFVDNADTNQVTPATLHIPRERGKHAQITLRLKGYSTYGKQIDLSDSTQVSGELTRTKTTAPPPSPPSTGRPPPKPPVTPTQPAPDPDALIRP
jgi:serine/threonine-protein kinase